MRPGLIDKCNNQFRGHPSSGRKTTRLLAKGASLAPQWMSWFQSGSRPSINKPVSALSIISVEDSPTLEPERCIPRLPEDDNSTAWLSCDAVWTWPRQPANVSSRVFISQWTSQSRPGYQSVGIRHPHALTLAFQCCSRFTTICLPTLGFYGQREVGNINILIVDMI